MPVRPGKLEELEKRLAWDQLFERDFQEQFVLSSGRGGQKLQKTRNCVVLKHKPTGIVVKCGKDRSREVNRFLARRMLAEQVERRSHALAPQQEPPTFSKTPE